MDDFVCSSPVNPVAAALLGLGGSISREHRGKPKRILIEPKSMSARHHLALSVEHRTTPLTLSIAARQHYPNNQTVGTLYSTAPGWSLGSIRSWKWLTKDYKTTLSSLLVPKNMLDPSVCFLPHIMQNKLHNTWDLSDWGA